MASTAEKRAAFKALHETGLFRAAQPLGRRQRADARASGLQGAGVDQQRLRLDAGPADYGARPRRPRSPICRALRRREPADQRRFRIRLRGRPRGRGGKRAARGRGRRRRALDRGPQPAKPAARSTTARRRWSACAPPAPALGDSGALLIARTEVLLDDASQVAAAIDSLVAFAAAGADCLYAPGVRKPDDIRAMVQAVAPKPLNVLAMDPAMTLARIRRSRRAPGQRRRLARPRRLGGGDASGARASPQARSRVCARARPSRELNAIFAAYRPGAK